MKRSNEIGGRFTGGRTFVLICEANTAAKKLHDMQPKKMALKLRCSYTNNPTIGPTAMAMLLATPK